eukprot:Lithocolla_globosa_v1_NODE_3469_length_1661_cov_21.691158.p1 type:complete len:267 gc:universal NODE_3469_length_1661_cov_21.691158:230-1030(+)
MPSLLPKGQSQHSVEEGNLSRLVTKTRWVVEAYHARFKKWKFFDGRISNYHIPFLGQYMRIVSAALNRFRGPLFTSVDRVGDIQRAHQMLTLAKNPKQNEVASFVERGKYSSRSKSVWCCISGKDALPDFPKITEEELQQTITFGCYQLRQCRPYTEEHLNGDGDYELEYAPERDGDLIRVRVRSRHKNATKYFLWLRYSPEGVKGWYCQCKAGKRTVGCCAHVASVIWYLGHARHNPESLNFNHEKVWSALIDAAGVEEEELDDE